MWMKVGSKNGIDTTTEARRYRFTDEDLPYEADALTYHLKCESRVEGEDEH